MNTPTDLSVDDFDFALPDELIAQHPAASRASARLLDARQAQAVDRHVHDLPALLNPGDLLVVNNTRVIKARLWGKKSDTGGAVELLVERLLNRHQARHEGGHEVHAHLRASKSPRAGQRITILGRDQQDAFEVEVLGRAGPDESLFHLRLPSDVLALLDAHGHVPLPPYITHADEDDDVRRYQTVYADRPGAVAAPTAGLHIDEAMLDALSQRGVQRAQVTLHVGAGTFLPVRTHSLADHRMHSEWFDVPQATVDAVRTTRDHGGRVVAVGTTTVRALESAAGRALQATQGDTDIFITPGFGFQVVDLLMTNFHLPKSTLMMLVSAFAGREHIMTMYAHAMEQRYRFFSYGDAMLLARR
jgi:S-adenosylmethionine:tRNA ribosyltransferase-isomerase